MTMYHIIRSLFDREQVVTPKADVILDVPESPSIRIEFDDSVMRNAGMLDELDLLADSGFGIDEFDPGY